jgi:Bacteriophage lambda head decoration protein D
MANPVITNNDIRPLVLGGANYDARTVLSGEDLSAGEVVGIVTASGKLKLCDSASADGSQVAAAVMTKAVDATGGDVTDQDVLISGEVDGDQLVFGGTDTLADHFDELRDVGIIAVDTAKIGGQDNQ